MKILSKTSSQKSSSNPIFPSELSAKLFFTGATLGPVVDSLHNQSLLLYDRAPISIPSSIAASVFVPSPLIQSADTYLFCSSWYIPPLLGFAYVVLGAVLPRLMQRAVGALDDFKDDYGSEGKKSGEVLLLSRKELSNDTNDQMILEKDQSRKNESQMTLKRKALLAVTSTALIIKLSDFLQTNPSFASAIQKTIIHSSGLEIPTYALNLGIMIAAAMTQWVTLDRTFYALLTALLVGVGGPLSELPFVQYGFWHYIPDAADYFPVKELVAWLQSFSPSNADLFFSDYSNLALSSITGPCYFAVTMDAIALGRWLEIHSDNDPDTTLPPCN